MSTRNTFGLTPRRDVMANGAVVTVQEVHSSPVVSLSAAFRAGSVCDPIDHLGVAHFLSTAADRGTELRSEQAIAEDLDDRGMALTLSATRHQLELEGKCLAEDFEVLLDLVIEVATQPSVPEDAVGRVRAEVLTSLAQDRDSPASRSVERLMATLYGADHPYGRNAKGTIRSVQEMGRTALVEFHRRWFAPSRLSVVVVGAVPASQVVETVARRLEGWRHTPDPEPEIPPVQPPAGRRQEALCMPGKAQVDIAYGFIGVPRSDPAYHACWILNNVFGEFGMGGRLGRTIRERQGMAYYAFSRLEAGVIAGPLVVRAGVAPANVDRALASIDAEVATMASRGVTDQELDDSKRFLVGSMSRRLETSEDIAAFLQTSEFFGLGLDYDRRLPGLLAAVTRDHVLSVSGRVLDTDRATVVVAGPPVEEATSVAAAST